MRFLALLALIGYFFSVFAQENTRYEKQIEALQKEMELLKKKSEENEIRSRIEVDHLKQQIEKISQQKNEPTSKESATDKALMEEIEKALQETPKSETTGIVSVPAGKATLRLIDISLDSLSVVGSSSARESTVRQLHGGGHDPKKRGFTNQNNELTLKGAVDPYFTAQANIVFQLDSEGETILELEEIFAETTSLPWGLTLKTGQYFTPFGRFNPQHPHSWSFVDQSVINTRLLGGDGTRGLATQISWLAPTPWYFELIGGIQNANGIAPSFLGGGEGGEEEPEEGGVTFETELPRIERDVRSFSEMLYFFRTLHSVDLSDTFTLNMGASYMIGPNATGEHTRTHMVGGDLYFKWLPEANDHGFPFVSWHTEAMYRHFEVDDVQEILLEDDGSFAGIGFVSPKRKLQDWGLFSQVDVGIAPHWVAGLRYDYADSDSQDKFDFHRQERQRGSLALTYFFTEFSKLRLQYNLDCSNLDLDPDHNRYEHSVWLQFEFLLGSHGAHNF